MGGMGFKSILLVKGTVATGTMLNFDRDLKDTETEQLNLCTD